MDGFNITWEIWLILAAACVVLELLTNTFALFAIAGGCIVAMIASICRLGIVGEVLGLAIGAVVTFVALRPFAKKYLGQDVNDGYVSNMDALVGRETVASENSNEQGVTRVRIDGDCWQAKTADGDSIAAGERLAVTGYDSIVLIVKKIV